MAEVVRLSTRGDGLVNRPECAIVADRLRQIAADVERGQHGRSVRLAAVMIQNEEGDPPAIFGLGPDGADWLAWIGLADVAKHLLVKLALDEAHGS